MGSEMCIRDSREGNSDRRAALAVKQYAKNNPHRMGPWSADSKSTVSSMADSDFFGNEKSVTIPAATTVKIELVAMDGSVTTLKEGLALEAGEVLDGTFMSVQALRTFFAEQIELAKKEGVLFSLHMKATMMKVSDPIILVMQSKCSIKMFLKSTQPLSLILGWM